MSTYQVVCLGEGEVKNPEETRQRIAMSAYVFMLLRDSLCFRVDTDTEFGRIADEAIKTAKKYCPDKNVSIIYERLCHALGSADGKTLLDPFCAQPDEQITGDLLGLFDLVKWVRMDNCRIFYQTRALIVYTTRPDGLAACAKRYAESIPISVYDMALPPEPFSPVEQMPPEFENSFEIPPTNPFDY